MQTVRRPPLQKCHHEMAVTTAPAGLGLPLVEDLSWANPDLAHRAGFRPSVSAIQLGEAGCR